MTAVAAAACAGPAGLCALAWLRGAETAGRWAGILSASVAVVAAAVSLIGWLRRGTDGAAGSGDAALRAHRLELLAARVSRRCSDEERQRRLLDPYPLPVSWHTLGPPVGDQWSVVRQGARDAVLYPDLPEPAAGEPAWNRRDAHRWLAFLARHLHRRGAHDVAWWELAQAVPPRARAPIWAVVRAGPGRASSGSWAA